MVTKRIGALEAGDRVLLEDGGTARITGAQPEQGGVYVIYRADNEGRERGVVLPADKEVKLP